jgi:predicted nucleic acid-binding protein
LSNYADSSFFVSFYLQDDHAVQVNRWMSARPSVFLTSFQHVELAHAVYQHVFRGWISQAEATVVMNLFEKDRANGLWHEVEMPPRLYARAIELASRHVAFLGTRTLDTLHVAAALELQASAFWTFDQRQAALAQAAGLTTN